MYWLITISPESFSTTFITSLRHIRALTSDVELFLHPALKYILSNYLQRKGQKEIEVKDFIELFYQNTEFPYIKSESSILQAVKELVFNEEIGLKNKNGEFISVSIVKAVKDEELLHYRLTLEKPLEEITIEKEESKIIPQVEREEEKITIETISQPSYTSEDNEDRAIETIKKSISIHKRFSKTSEVVKFLRELNNIIAEKSYDTLKTSKIELKIELENVPESLEKLLKEKNIIQ